MAAPVAAREWLAKLRQHTDNPCGTSFCRTITRSSESCSRTERQAAALEISM
jgi:hypothetical protein